MHRPYPYRIRIVLEAVHGASSYSYDDDGNLIGVNTSFLGAYDAENRLVQKTIGGIETHYTYDGLGNRVSAQRGATTTRYYYDQAGRLLFEANGSGTIITYYFFKGMRLVAMSTASGATYFYHYDKNANTVAMTDGNGNPVNAYAYTPFGGIAGTTETVANPFKYVGAYGVMDEGNGIYFMKNRYYDSTTGRFLQKDPIGLAGGTNPYRYVDNNPVTLVDPEGLLPDDSPQWDRIKIDIMAHELDEPIDWATNVAAGFGDAFFTSWAVNRLTGADAYVNKTSSAYRRA
jgi:RHS repeat-associated protein